MKTIFKKCRELTMAVAVVAGVVMSLLSPAVASANSSAFVPTAKVSFTFDDGMTSSLLAAQTLQPYGYSGTQYVITGCVGMSATPNTCASGPDYSYLTWDQITELRSTYGWEIGSHSVNHPSFQTLNAGQAAQELTGSRDALLAHGINPTAFAFPYGEYNDVALAEAAKVYSSVRRFEDTDNNLYPYNDNLIMIRGVEAGITVAKVQQYIDEAVANNYWLVLVFHEISPTASTNPDDYEYTPAELAQIADYVKLKNVPVSNMTDGIATSSTNLLPNGGFANGIADGWTTDDTTNIVADSTNHGSYPESTKSVSITAAAGTTGNTHLFSPQVTVNSANTYVIKSFVNVTAITSGAIGYYIDEYDVNGVWISGQDKSAVASIKAADVVKVRALNFTYKPSSAAVVSARIEVVVNKGSGIKAYVDSLQWFPESAINNAGAPATKTGDVNGDNAVDALDLSIVLSNWNKSGQAYAQGDLNGDTLVDALDLSTVLSKWSQ